MSFLVFKNRTNEQTIESKNKIGNGNAYKVLIYKLIRFFMEMINGIKLTITEFCLVDFVERIQYLLIHFVFQNRFQTF